MLKLKNANIVQVHECNKQALIETIIKDIRDLEHSVINWYRGKNEFGKPVYRKIWVCTNHCCGLDGVLAVRE